VYKMPTTVTVAILTLASLEDVTEIGMCLFVSCFPRKPIQVSQVSLPRAFFGANVTKEKDQFTSFYRSEINIVITPLACSINILSCRIFTHLATLESFRASSGFTLTSPKLTTWSQKVKITISAPSPFIFKDLLNWIEAFNDVNIKVLFGAKMYLYVLQIS
jgi:hypothetical protein